MDVIWFNRRDMPANLFEVGFSTDMLNSLAKFKELRDFYTQFSIVAPPHRKSHFEVFRAGSDKIVHVRSEGTDTGLGGLFCYECDEPIPVEGSFSTVPIE